MSDYKKYTMTPEQVEAMFFLLNAINLEHLKRGEIVLNDQMIKPEYGMIIKLMYYGDKFAEQK